MIYVSSNKGVELSMILKKEGKALNILVNPELYDELKKEADRRYLSMGALVRMILGERYFSDKEER